MSALLISGEASRGKFGVDFLHDLARIQARSGAIPRGLLGTVTGFHKTLGGTVMGSRVLEFAGPVPQLVYCFFRPVGQLTVGHPSDSEGVLQVRVLRGCLAEVFGARVIAAWSLCPKEPLIRFQVRMNQRSRVIGEKSPCRLGIKPATDLGPKNDRPGKP